MMRAPPRFRTIGTPTTPGLESLASLLTQLARDDATARATACATGGGDDERGDTGGAVFTEQQGSP